MCNNYMYEIIVTNDYFYIFKQKLLWLLLIFILNF